MIKVFWLGEKSVEILLGGGERGSGACKAEEKTPSPVFWEKKFLKKGGGGGGGGIILCEGRIGGNALR